MTTLIADKLSSRLDHLPDRDYISHSAISTFQQCPLKFKFRYVDQLPEEITSASLVFGAAIHSAIEFHFNEHMAGKDPPATLIRPARSEQVT